MWLTGMYMSMLDFQIFEHLHVLSASMSNLNDHLLARITHSDWENYASIPGVTKRTIQGSGLHNVFKKITKIRKKCMTV